MDNLLFPQFLSNFILQKISINYGLSTNDIYMISPIFAGFLAKILVIDLELKYIVIFPILGFLYWCYTEKYLKQNQYMTGIFYDESVLFDIAYNASKNPDFIMDVKWNTEKMSTLVSDNYVGSWIPQLGQKVYFKHKDITEGYYEFKEGIKKTEKEEKKYRYFVLAVKKNYSNNIAEYCSLLRKWKEDEQAKKMMIELYYKKITPKNTHELSSVMYSGIGSKQDRYTQFMESYFSDNRNLIWDIVSQVQYNPEKFYTLGQVPRANILFHGPPGTGKSSLVYRLAICLERGIRNIDLTSYFNDPDKLESDIRDTVSPQRNIILFEEIDVALKYIETRNKKEDEKQRTLQVEELLEIFQGAVAIPNSIIIATTNNLEYIKQLCPALIRPGRLTPIYCGYINWKNLQDMSRYYFGKELDIHEANINISTSEISEIAVNLALKDKEKGFELFQEYLKKKLIIN